MPVKMTMKEKVLGIITRRGATGKTPILQGSKASSDELKALLLELEKEGKIKAWPYRSRAGGAAVYTLPGAKDPRTKEMMEGARPAPEKKAARAMPAASTAKPAPKNGSGPYASVIADLEAERAKALDRVEQIDIAIATLKALA